MNLLDVVHRRASPEPWAEGDNIPWNEPAFSRRMLREHLSQAHDRASRRVEIIDQHVDWIHRVVLHERPSRVLDLGCGPGLYCSRLAMRGHTCVGIDYSPASIAHARKTAAEQGQNILYREEDIRVARFGTGFDLVMLLFDELNVFHPSDARMILGKAHHALVQGGMLLLEPHIYSLVQSMGQRDPSWYSAQGGLFSDNPHLCLLEPHWDSAAHAATHRYYVVDATSGEVTRHAQTFQAYTDDEYVTMLDETGFEGVTTYSALTGEPGGMPEDLFALVALKPVEE